MQCIHGHTYLLVHSVAIRAQLWNPCDAMPEPLDPRSRTDLRKNGRPVDGFRLAGRLAELAIKRSLVWALGALFAADLPATIDMRLDRLGVRQLKTHHEDRVLAVRIANYVREQLVDHGVNIREAIVADSGGEHDMIGDVVRRAYIQGKVSIELKCRRLWSEKGKEVAREKQREEDVSASKWWRKSLRDNPGKWGGRAILLVNLEENGRLTSRCECNLTQGSWEAWWGWKSSRLATELASRGRASNVVPVPKAKAAAAAGGGALPRAKAAPKAKPKPRDQPFPALSFRREPPGAGNPLVGRVQDLFNATDPKRSSSNIGRSVGTVKRRRTEELGTWTPEATHTDELFEAPRRHGPRPGSGRPEWLATQRVMRIIHAEL